jgi:alpha-N-arabinofuranosidase
VVLPVKTQAQSGKLHFASAARDETTGDVIVKIVNGEATAATVKFNVTGLATSLHRAQVTVLASPNKLDENSLLEPTKIAPQESTQQIASGNFLHHVPAFSLTVLRIR